MAALLAELLLHARAAVGAPAAGMDEGDFGGELLIALRVQAWRAQLPGVIPAWGEFEGFA
jgi:hypothetical protein